MNPSVIPQNILYLINWLIVIISISLLIFITIISVHYGIHIYKSFVLIKTLENKYNSKLIYVKDTEYKSINKILMLIYNKTIISINDNNSLRKILQENQNKKIIMLIKSTGGYISSSDSMLNLLETHKPLKTAYVPSYAMSAATLLTLVCDKIYINRYASIGPTDPQINVLNEDISFRTLQKLIENKSIDKINDSVLFNYYENKKLYDDNILYIKKYISKHKKRNIKIEDEEKIISSFSSGDIPHHTEFTPNILNKVININYDIPKDILEIYEVFNFIFSIN